MVSERRGSRLVLHVLQKNNIIINLTLWGPRFLTGTWSTCRPGHIFEIMCQMGAISILNSNILADIRKQPSLTFFQPRQSERLTLMGIPLGLSYHI